MEKHNISITYDDSEANINVSVTKNGKVSSYNANEVKTNGFSLRKEPLTKDITMTEDTTKKGLFHRNNQKHFFNREYVSFEKTPNKESIFYKARKMGIWLMSFSILTIILTIIVFGLNNSNFLNFWDSNQYNTITDFLHQTIGQGNNWLITFDALSWIDFALVVINVIGWSLFFFTRIKYNYVLRFGMTRILLGTLIYLGIIFWSMIVFYVMFSSFSDMQVIQSIQHFNVLIPHITSHMFYQAFWYSSIIFFLVAIFNALLSYKKSVKLAQANWSNVKMKVSPNIF